MADAPAATADAASTAQQAVTAQHGDNDPDATARLRFMVEDLDHRFPRAAIDRDRPMCAAWDDHEGGTRA